MRIGRLEEAKKVSTYSHDKVENGYVIELLKEQDKTLAYLSVVLKNKKKGFHLHRIRRTRFLCLKGKIKLTLYKPGVSIPEEYILSEDDPKRVFIPENIAFAFENIGDEKAFLINFPDPPYDPSLTDEQVEYTEEELKQGVIK